MNGKVRLRGFSRRRKIEREGGADWDAIGALMYLSTMTPEEEIDFMWSHPELEGKTLAPRRTEEERRYEEKIYRRIPE